MLDLVYVLGNGSSWNNNELRFSLRSVEKNLRNYGKVFIVGENPGFLKNIIHIPYPDELGDMNADGNIIRKMLHVCKDARLSEEFLFMNDDYIIHAETDASRIPNLHKGDLNSFEESFYRLNYWRSRLQNTRDALNKQGLTAFHYDCHAPMRMNKRAFLEIIPGFNYEKLPGLCMKSLYGNGAKLDGTEITTEKVRIFSKHTSQQINELVKNALFLAYNDDGLNNSLKYWLSVNFPDASSLEMESMFIDKITDIADWQLKGQNYERGCQIFNQYMKHPNFSYLFQFKSASLQNKLNYKLLSILKNL